MSKRKTHEEFVKEMAIVNPDIEILGIYVNSHTKILVRCKIDKYEWEATPANLLYGKGCKKCAIEKNRIKSTKTHKQFLLEMSIINPNIEVLGVYKGDAVNILCRCKICDCEWNARPHNLLCGTGCPECAKLKNANNQRKTHEQFISELAIANPDIEVLEKYKGARTPILVKCKIDGHEWYATPDNLLRGKRCPKCTGHVRRTHDEFVSEITAINPNIEIIGKFINTSTKILCRCKIDGFEWMANPNDLLKGTGCPKCIGRYKTHNEFITELSAINPNIEILTEYVDSNTKVLCKCKIDGYEWWALPYCLLVQGTGCPRCIGRMKTHEEFVEEVRFINPDVEIIGKYIDSKTKILVKCKKCGHEWYVQPCSLLACHGCPNCYKSRGENRIEVFLKNNSIDYILHHKYEGLIGLGGNLLSYDFYLPNYNILIEYQGRQHYEPVDMFGGEEQFVIQQEHDKRKRQYAKEHNINLLEIPYWDFENIETILKSYLLKQQVA